MKPVEGNHPPIRLLLIDDERGFVATLSKRLAKRNVKATQAFSGREGIQILRKADFDVVLLDLKMEDMDGLEVLKIIKIMIPDLPVIMLSGHASEETAHNGMRAGAYDYLTKPYDIQELIDKIASATKSDDE
ncbi:MAG: chemotaxis protein CheY [Desulfatitalea sp. BRH_c12]|nr:MAG: chemotaxis protein CheY [Desulfatitalea sp. BRH_c12]